MRSRAAPREADAAASSPPAVSKASKPSKSGRKAARKERSLPEDNGTPGMAAALIPHPHDPAELEEAFLDAAVEPTVGQDRSLVRTIA